jgi:hypothetical protein
MDINDLILNHIQVIGSHNSYRTHPTVEMFNLMMGSTLSWPLNWIMITPVLKCNSVSTALARSRLMSNMIARENPISGPGKFTGQEIE